MEYHGLLLKASYWRWPDRNLPGNAMFTHDVVRSTEAEDFYTKVLGASFSDAMKEITET